MKTDIPNIGDIYIYIYTAGRDFTNYTYGPEPVQQLYFYKEILRLTFDQARCLFLDGKVHCQRLRGEFVDGALAVAVLRDGYWSDVN